MESSAPAGRVASAVLDPRRWRALARVDDPLSREGAILRSELAADRFYGVKEGQGIVSSQAPNTATANHD